VGELLGQIIDEEVAVRCWRGASEQPSADDG
jgi:hypothetical protein